MIWYLIGVLVFVAAVYFYEQTEHHSIGPAALQTAGVVVAIFALTVVGGALWEAVL